MDKIRNPKAENRKKAEARIPAAAPHRLAVIGRGESLSEFRFSPLSGLGFQPSESEAGQ